MALVNKDGSPNAGAFIKLGILAVVVFFIVIPVVFHTLSWVKVEGNEAVVRQDLFQGVMNDVWTSGTKVFCGWTTDIYKYNIGTQKITFDKKEANPNSEYDRIEVNCGENGGQKAFVAISVNYRVGYVGDKNGLPVLSPEKLVTFHKEGLRTTYQDMIVKRCVTEVVNRVARPKKAMDIYSGQGYVDFVKQVDTDLKSDESLKERGIFVENTIIYSVHLDPKYEQEIADKVLATQQKLKLEQQTLAKQEEAKMIFAQSQANVEQIRQEAEAAKIKMITAAEGDKQREILAAEAEKQKRVLEAEGQRDANLALASGKLAVGTAEAQVEQLKRDAMYSGEAGARRASVEIADLTAKRLAGLFAGVSIVPEKTILSTTRSVPGLVVGINDDKDQNK